MNALKQIKKTALITAVLSMMIGSTVVQAGTVQLDPNLKDYTQVSGVSGKLNSIGSDTLNNLMTYWAEGFKAIYPNVTIEIEGKGSSTAPPALISGTAQLGPMSRSMKSKEVDEFEKKYGYKPLQVKTSVDALAVYVNKDNPIECLDLKQLDAVFSSTLKRGGQPVATWGDLGLTGEWKNRPISLYGRNSASGTYGFFKEHVLKKGDYKDSVKEQPGSSAVVQGVSSDLGGIGYSGVGYKTSGVKFVKLSDTGDCFEPTADAALSGKYPLSRYLYIYVNKKPGEALDSLVLEFLRYVQSKQGQQVVVKDGYFPLPAQVAQKEMDSIAAR